jgi:hypothetical protein
MRAGRPRSLLLLPSKKRGHLDRTEPRRLCHLIPWERRRLAVVLSAVAFAKVEALASAGLLVLGTQARAPPVCLVSFIGSNYFSAVVL